MQLHLIRIYILLPSAQVGDRRVRPLCSYTRARLNTRARPRRWGRGRAVMLPRRRAAWENLENFPLVHVVDLVLQLHV